MSGEPRPTGQPPQGKRSREPKGARGFQRWAMLLIASALLGGLAGAALTRESVPWAVIFSLLVAAVALAALSIGLLDDDAEAPRRAPLRRRRPPQHSGDHPVPVRPATAPPLPRPGPPGSGDAPPIVKAPDPSPASPPGGRLSPPPDLPPASERWWEQRPGPPQAAPRTAAPPADDRVPRHAQLAATEFAEFGEEAQIAQCPQCGSFRIHVGNQPAPPWRFACHECGRRWQWQPGMSWPSVQVSPNARRPAEQPGW